MWFDILLFVIGIPVGAVSGWAFGKLVDVADEREIWSDVQITSLKSDASSELSGQLGWVSQEDGTEVKDPYIADIYIWSTGKRDVPNDAFNNGEPLVLDLEVPIVSKLAEEDLRQMDSVALDVQPDGKVSFKPSLVRKRQLLHHRYLVDGIPKRTITNPIVDVDEVRSFYADWRTNPKNSRALPIIGIIFLLLSGASFVCVPVIGAIYYANEGHPLDWPDWTVFASIGPFAAFGIAGITLVTISGNATRRASRALRILNSGLAVPMIDPSRSYQQRRRIGI